MDVCRQFLLICLTGMIGTFHSQGQQVVNLADHPDQHVFVYDQIEYLEDPDGSLDFREVRSPAFSRKFRPSTVSTPHNDNRASTYWYRIRIRHDKNITGPYILEFFDQTIDAIRAYMPDSSGRYQVWEMGDCLPFSRRLFAHKNFELPLEQGADGVKTYYFRVQSVQPAAVTIVLRSVSWFIHYALNEYFFFGIFYGMILIFSLHNLLMFLAVRQTQYLYYILYILSVGMYEMCADGIAYQYLWPNSPAWNQYAFAFSLYCMSMFALLFTRKLLYLRTKAPVLDKLILGVMAARTLFLLTALLFNKTWLDYKSVEFIPLTTAFCTGIYIRLRGYRPARFFVLGYSFLFLGFILKSLIMIGYEGVNINTSMLGYYSPSLCFVMEMMLFSFAIGDRVRLLKKKKEKAQQRIMQQMKEHARLKDQLNLRLEAQVQERTKEVLEKSEIIGKQNEELSRTNTLLKRQAAEISRMNSVLEQDNRQLQTSVEKVTRARALSAEMDFGEFSKIYPDADSCYHFLAELKWKNGYTCRKCGQHAWINGHSPYSRRCRSCSYDESATSHTIFQNIRIPVNKAFYMIFLIYASKGKISSHKLSAILDIRQGTCWTYSTRVKKVMSERKKELRQAGEQGWSRLVL